MCYCMVFSAYAVTNKHVSLSFPAFPIQGVKLISSKFSRPVTVSFIWPRCCADLVVRFIYAKVVAKHVFLCAAGKTGKIGLIMRAIM